MADEQKIEVPDPRAKSGSEIATAPGTKTGTAEPVADIGKVTGGETFAQKVDVLHTKHFADTALGNDTKLWNAVMAFKNDVVKLAEESGAK